jgi:hypothetical protein
VVGTLSDCQSDQNAEEEWNYGDYSGTADHQSHGNCLIGRSTSNATLIRVRAVQDAIGDKRSRTTGSNRKNASSERWTCAELRFGSANGSGNGAAAKKL